MSKVILVGVAGGSCSGKTTLVRKAVECIGELNSSVLYQDNYYIDQSKNFDKDGGTVNFDHPMAIDFSLLAEHLRQLKDNNSIRVPIYDFATHTRQQEAFLFEPRSIVFLDGILILSQPSIVNLLDETYFVECSEEIRLERRIHRDILERGRSEQGVRDQFERQVAPMHNQYVEPSKVHAGHVLSQADYLHQLEDGVPIMIEMYRRHFKST